MKKRLTLLSVLVLALTLLGQNWQTAAQATSMHYVSLGDSVAAGAGLPIQDPSPPSLACGRSSQAYPLLVATKLGTTPHQYACGGATTTAGISGTQVVNGLPLPPQIDQVFASGKPKPTHISLTVGTNDVQWSTFISKCHQSTCGTWQDNVAVAQLEYKLFGNLRSSIEQIKSKYGPGEQLPKLALTGYFLPVSNSQPMCANTTGLTSDEITWIRTHARIVNGVIATVAAMYDFVYYTPVDFGGHELCSADPWIQGFQNPAPYHPTAVGQQAIATAVYQTLRD